MDALWSLEDKWKLTTQQALILFVCTAVAVIGLCMATILKKMAQRKEAVDRDKDRGKWAEPSCDWVSIKRMLMGSVRWSGANKWEEKAAAPPLLGLKKGCEGVMGWQSHNSDSPVWQRPILMGEKCELPRFSGLILYDESGNPLDQSLCIKETSPKHDMIHQVIILYNSNINYISN